METTINERLARIEVTTDYVKDGLDKILIRLDLFDARITRLERAWIYAGGVLGAITIYFKQLKGLIS